MKYIIYNRYEYSSKDGKIFTKWFKVNSSLYDTKEDATKALKDYKNFCKPIDKKSKVNREYEIRYIDEDMLALPKYTRPKGRPKKIAEDILNNIAKKLIKSKKDRIAIDEEIGVYLYNDNNYKQYISNKFAEKFPDIQIHWIYDDNYVVYAIKKPKDLTIIYY